MKAHHDKSFLVFSGGNDRAIMAFLRASRLCSSRAHVVARTTNDRILRSDFKHQVTWVRPTQELSLEIFSEAVSRTRASVGVDTLVVLPSTEYFNTFLLRNRRAIEDMGCTIPLVDSRLYMRLTQKASAADFFSAAGLSIPREISPRKLPEQPVVAKPFRNISPTGQSLYPHLLESCEQLERFMATQDPKDYFFQEYVRGESNYLLFHISKKEDCDFLWSQRNLLQQPNGKSMLLAEPSSIHDSPTATRMVLALRRAGFHGLGMVEIICTGDRKAFIEMNPRIWGPAQFCLDQGQPLLQAFIGEALHADPLRFVDRQPNFRRRRYFWLGGVLETLAAGQSPTGHAAGRSVSLTITQNVLSDIYLRKDSWRCFALDAMRYFTDRHDDERTQD